MKDRITGKKAAYLALENEKCKPVQLQAATRTSRRRNRFGSLSACDQSVTLARTGPVPPGRKHHVWHGRHHRRQAQGGKRKDHYDR